MSYQRTIKDKVIFSGIGLHSGKETKVTLRPAEAGTGIVFHRVDLTPSVSIEAVASNVVNTRLSTTIGKNGAVVATIEHLVAALRGCEVDNVHIDIDGPEVPILDGSARHFLQGIESAGVVTSSKPRKYIVIKKPVTVSDGDKKATLIPSRFFKITFEMSYSHPAIKNQYKTMIVDKESFRDELSPARTFGFLAEVEMLKANGLAQGGSLENAIVIGDEGILNKDGLRFEDELVSHKILDSVGDLSLAGYYIVGHLKAYKSGHDLNHKLVTELLAKRDSYKIVEPAAKDTATSPLIPIPVPELAWQEN